MISICPYPENRNQEILVNHVVRTADIISKIKNLITLPLKKISALFCTHSKNNSLVERKISLVSPICIKTDKETLDHKCYYVIREGKVYFKPIAASFDAPWKEIPFHKKAIYINADGDNLIVLDENKRIHYAKTYGIEFHLNDKGWEVSSFKFKWNKNWFNIDGVASIVNFFKPAGLYAMEGAAALAISHKGPDTLYSTDRAGKKHPDPFIGVSTIYMLNPSRTRIFFADPWLHNKFHNEITGPEDGRFVIEGMDASASTIFVMQRAKDAAGKEINKMYSRFADFDSIGSNPFLPATYNLKNRIPLVRVLPAEDWLEQPSIILEGRAHLTNKVTILQTGRSQAQRQLRVEGTDREGHAGYYVKQIYGTVWKFEQTNHFIDSAAFLSETHGPGLQKGPQLAYDYPGLIKLEKSRTAAVLKKFSSIGLNERGLHTTLDIQLDSGKIVSCPLYARRGLKHILGLNRLKPNWTLVVPENSELPFKTQIVRVLEKSHEIVIEGKRFKASFARGSKEQRIKSSLPLFQQILIKGMLLALGPIKTILKINRRILDKLFGKKKILNARERFFESLYLQDIEDTQKVLKQLIAKNPELAPKPLTDFLCLPQVVTHLKELMKGANVIIDEKDGKWRDLLTKSDRVQYRRCSHKHLDKKSFSLETPLFGELLLWIDLKGKLRLQFEAHSLRNIFKNFYHLVDFLKYKLHGKQQGPYGSSNHTDTAPLTIKIQDKSLDQG